MLLTLVILLLLANAATLAFFWLDRSKKPMQQEGGPKEFLVKELTLSTAQQQQYEELVKQHRQAVDAIRQQVKAAKDNLFALVKVTEASDSTKQAAASDVSKLTEKIDLLTLNHFQQVRKICTPEQQQKFDQLIGEITRMMAAPHPGMRPEGPPPGQEPPR